MSEHARLGRERWHSYFSGGKDSATLYALLAEDAVFHSPVVHSPQIGRDKVFAYLEAASHVLGDQPSFTYVREIVDGDHLMMEFTASMDGIHINGIDLVTFDTDGLIKDFKVMVRPMKAVTMLWEKMGAQLAKPG